MSGPRDEQWRVWADRLRHQPEDSDHWSVFADWLTDIDDVRGDLLRLSRALASSCDTSERCRIEQQIADLEERHRSSWMGGLDLTGPSFRWQSGFLVGAHLGWSMARTVPLLQRLSALPSARLLRELSLGFGRSLFATEEIPALVSSLQAFSLTDLALSNGHNLEAPVALALAACPSLSSLRSLTVGSSVGWGVGPEGARALVTSPYLAGLQRLDLSHASLGDEGAAVIASCAELPSLSALLLNLDQIGPAGAKALAGSARLRTLTTLSVNDYYGVGVGDEGVSALAASSHLSSLVSLSLNYARIGKAGARALAESPCLSSLVSLSLHNNEIGDEGARSLADSRGLPALRELNVGFNEIGPTGAQALVSSLPALTRLALDFNRLEDRGAQAVADGATAALRSLDLSHNSITASGARSLARAPALSSLEELRLDYNRVGADGLDALLTGPRLPALKALSLNKNELASVSPPQKLQTTGPRLTRLSLEENKLTDRSLRTLLSHPALAELVLLRIKGNQLTNESAGAGRPSLTIER